MPACDCGPMTITSNAEPVFIPEDPSLTIQLLESRISELEAKCARQAELLDRAKDLIERLTDNDFGRVPRAVEKFFADLEKGPK